MTETDKTIPPERLAEIERRPQAPSQDEICELLRVYRSHLAQTEPDRSGEPSVAKRLREAVARYSSTPLPERHHLTAQWLRDNVCWADIEDLMAWIDRRQTPERAEPDRIGEPELMREIRRKLSGTVKTCSSCGHKWTAETFWCPLCKPAAETSEQPHKRGAELLKALDDVVDAVQANIAGGYVVGLGGSSGGGRPSSTGPSNFEPGWELAEARARIAELEAQLAAVMTERGQAWENRNMLRRELEAERAKVTEARLCIRDARKLVFARGGHFDRVDLELGRAERALQPAAPKEEPAKEPHTRSTLDFELAVCEAHLRKPGLGHSERQQLESQRAALREKLASLPLPTMHNQTPITALAEDWGPKTVRSIAVSCASFIAAIDADSNRVADYLESRLTPLAQLVHFDAGVRRALEVIASDARRPAASTPAKEFTTVSVPAVPRLAEYIFDWLRTRNGAELDEAIGNMSVSSLEGAKGELELILHHGGRPPNWVPDERKGTR